MIGFSNHLLPISLATCRFAGTILDRSIQEQGYTNCFVHIPVFHTENEVQKIKLDPGSGGARIVHFQECRIPTYAIPVRVQEKHMVFPSLRSGA
jgi:hypothetical protein